MSAEEFIKAEYDLLWMFLADEDGNDTIQLLKLYEAMERFKKSK